MLGSGELSFRHAQRNSIGYAALWTFNLALVGMITAPGSGWAQSARDEKRIEFSIPAQPLISAISRFGEATGYEAVYDANLANARHSSDVRGLLTSAQALDRLLADTGLSARFVAERMFIIVPAQAASEPLVPPGPSPSAANSRYYALMQESLLDALCRSNSARPGGYRIIVVLVVGPTGTIESARRIGSTGEAGADRQFDAALSSVRFGESPPEGFAQPVRILIVPDAPGVTPGCAGADGRLRASRAAR